MNKVNKNLIIGGVPEGTSPNTKAVGLPWVGGKKSKYSDYEKCFPKDKSVLVDLFTGGGSVGFSSAGKFKKIVMNDIDYNIISLYRYLAGHEDLRKILDYEYSKRSFMYAHKALKNPYNCIEPVDRVKYTVADIFQSFNNGRGSYEGFEYNKNYYENTWECFFKIRQAIHKGNIQLENRSAFDILAEDFEKKDVFWFVDPPYENGLINSYKYYISMLEDWEQELLAHLLSICKGKFMLCGYRGVDGSIYDSILSKGDFHCYKLLDTCAFCGRNKKGKNKDKRYEYIWTNYPIIGLEEVQMRKAA